MCADFYGCCYATEGDGSIVKQKKESNSFDPVLIPPEFAKGKLKLENAGFDDIDAFIPSMIWLAGPVFLDIISFISFMILSLIQRYNSPVCSQNSNNFFKINHIPVPKYTDTPIEDSGPRDR